ncbi:MULTISPECIES: proton-conducting transporter transmembrane domain-containing protein [Thiorhodovibrio]|uniref:proton-conducting transporter transmembrane domain-containing protein n=1 Tax=Thiorhodovibrio TaxID=61593 RepID=UPI001913504F|nr:MULTISPECIES: proton-conducting transporter membrane subunit [Thiorhodovibrio]MBK5970098.1 hypothetical protein [Thiorhodovibrio winogradskyi]WPL13480.1 NAD(P)H-quinone oxidoreductase chain 4 1 [Thiorhodovibrio litoralis]
MTASILNLPWPTAPIAVVIRTWSWQALSPLDLMFLASLVTLLLALALGRWRLFTPLFAVGYGVQFWALAHTDLLTGKPLVASLVLRVLRQPVIWRYDSLSWFFAMLTIGAAFVCSLFALGLPGPRRRALVQGTGSPAAAMTGAGPGIWHLFHVALALSVLSSLCLFGSGNLLALYMSWELTVWALFLLLGLGGGLVLSTAIRYAAYSFAGGMFLLGALVLLFRAAGSFDFERVSAFLPALGLVQESLLGVLLLVALGLRLGALPLFAWQAESGRPPVAVFWHGIAARIGFFALLLMLSRMIGVDWLTPMGLAQSGGWLNPRGALCWMALALVLYAGWRAWRQTRADAVLGWLALSQTGFVLLALMVGGVFGTASGLLQLFSLGLAEAVLAGLCLVATPIMTATNRVEVGLRRLALGAALLAGASVVGLPPTLGFVSKWVLYDAIWTAPMLGWGRWPMLLLALIGSLLALLALMRLAAIMRASPVPGCHGRPYGIMAPVLGLSSLTLLAGIVPGPAMGWVAAMQQAIGVPALNWTLGGVDGRFDMLWLTFGQLLVLVPALAVLWWVWRQGRAQGQGASAGFWRVVESSRAGRALIQPKPRDRVDGLRMPKLQPLVAWLMDVLAAVPGLLTSRRIAPWTLSVTLGVLVIWAVSVT